MTIGNRIRKIREAKDYSQEYMAAKLQVTQPTYARIENGCTKLSTERLERIADILEVKTEDILRFQDKFIFINPTYTKASQNAGEVDIPVQDIKAIELLVHEVRDLREERNRLLSIIESFSK